MRSPWQRPLVGPFFLSLLVFQSACLQPATSVPRSSLHQAHSRVPEPFPKARDALVYEVEVLEPGATATRPIPVDTVDFQRALQQLARNVRVEGLPRKAARALLAASLAQQAEAASVSAGGDYLAEVSRDRVLSLVPRSQWGPVSLTPVAEEALRTQYQAWCHKRGGGDCLGLFDDEAFSSPTTGTHWHSPWRWTRCWRRCRTHSCGSWTRACWWGWWCGAPSCTWACSWCPSPPRKPWPPA